MTRRAWPSIAALGFVVLRAPGPAVAADKAHQQLMAEIRMLQEQQQQLQQVLGGLADTLKAITGKMDDQVATGRKSAADNKLLIDNIAEGVRILREKADDTNVRLSTVSQELDAVRQAVSTMPVEHHDSYRPARILPRRRARVRPRRTAPPARRALQHRPAPAARSSRRRRCSITPTATTPPATTTSRSWGSRRSSARSRGTTRPTTRSSISASLYGAGRYAEAAEAFPKVITNYRQADSVPVVYYKLGMSGPTAETVRRRADGVRDGDSEIPWPPTTPSSPSRGWIVSKANSFSRAELICLVTGYRVLRFRVLGSGFKFEVLTFYVLVCFETWNLGIR